MSLLKGSSLHRPLREIQRVLGSWPGSHDMGASRGSKEQIPRNSSMFGMSTYHVLHCFGTTIILVRTLLDPTG